ncbi:recombinase family protein [Bacillus sp. MUM 13]|uniref:recombinase family protein n=1 Tax=Bacillus sp. MUM 13 TaxID=1678001 RepID=UPI00147FC2F6|nr:recombinase family protein [Bacillus sp. MUM 13]
MNVVGYARKSIKIKNMSERDAVLHQEVAIKEYCEEHGYNLVKIYSDIGYSGVLAERPELNQMKEMLQRKRVNILVCYNQERFSRDLATSILLVVEILSYVDKIEFIVEGISSDSNRFKTEFLENAAKAAVDRKKLKKRLRDARRAKVVYYNYFRGTFKPLGLVQPNKEKLVPSTKENTRNLDAVNELRVYELIVLCYLSNMSLGAISRLIYREFGPTKRGSNWSPNTIKGILQNPVYAGILKSIFSTNVNSSPVETIEPVLSLEMFEYIQKKYSNERKGNKFKLSKYIPDLAICSYCLEPLRLSGKVYYCLNCNSEIGFDIYISLLKNEFKNLVHVSDFGKRTIKALDENKDKAESKINMIKNEIYKLEKRHEEIKQYFPNYSERREKSLAMNEEKQKKWKEELLLEKSYYRFLFGESLLSDEVNTAPIEQDYFLTLPYLVIVNFKEFIVHVKYHEKIFEKGDIHDYLL